MDLSFFVSVPDIVEWIDEYVRMNNSLPTIETIESKFEDFEVIQVLDAIPYL